MASSALFRCCALASPFALGLSSLSACNSKLPEELSAPASHEAAEQNAAEQSAPGQTALRQSETPTPGAGSPALPPAPGAPGERPSLQLNMGRGFQGKLAMRLQTSKGSRYDLRYLSLGNTARLQIDSIVQTPPAPWHLDALIWGESISLLDHQQRTVRTFPLRQIRPGEEPASTVETKKSSERRSIQGVFCEAYELQDGPTRVEACVGGLPGDFDVDKFEAVSGVDVPAWVEELLRQELLPLQAVAHDASGRELYRLDMVEYSPGPIEHELLSVPANYQPISSNSSAAPAPATAAGSSPGGQP